MSNLIKLAQHRAHLTGEPWAVVRRSHGLSVMSLRLTREAVKRGTVTLLQVAR